MTMIKRFLYNERRLLLLIFSILSGSYVVQHVAGITSDMVKTYSMLLERGIRHFKYHEYEKAFVCLDQVTKSNNEELRLSAYWLLGRMYYQPLGLKQNLELSFDYYKKIANHPSTRDSVRKIKAAACRILAEMFYTGQGTHKNIGQAIYYYQKAANQKYDLEEQMLANMSLGDLYLANGIDDINTLGEINQDIKMAIAYYHRVLDMNPNSLETYKVYAMACITLGDMYINDYLVGHDYQQAHNYYQRLLGKDPCPCADDQAYAHLMLGYIFLYGDNNMPQNIAKAREHFTVAAKSFNFQKQAQEQLGVLYRQSNR